MHYEQLYNPDGIEQLDIDEHSEVYIPILDDPIQPVEVMNVINHQLNPNKSCGPDAISAGIFRLFPIELLTFITLLINTIFYTKYPLSWMQSKLVNIFKKGSHKCCDNYRGINIINSLAKLYDYVLCNRLMKWFVPDREQAGALPKHGCVEHIISLRLLMDFARRKKTKLYVVYVDFSKAYDKIPRRKLMQALKHLGCGMVMLAALCSMYKVSHCLIGAAVVTSVYGIRQGSPTSCFLFTVYVNSLIRTIKQCGPDGFLEWLHSLLLMDDTIILATSRDKCIEKLTLLREYCDASEMVINTSKTKFMVINGDGQDRESIGVLQTPIEHCKSYCYLGCMFTDSGSVKDAIDQEVQTRDKHLSKLISFLCKNPDMPFIVKCKVVNSCFMASILYGCESWLNGDIASVNTMYMKAIKCLLGVRSTTHNDLCLVEIGMCPLRTLIKMRQNKFFKSCQERPADDPLIFCLSLTRRRNPIMKKYIDSIYAFSDNRDYIKHNILVSEKTKPMTYRTVMNPDLCVHEIYTCRDNYVPEHFRTIFTRLRLSSHNLKIETGRWSRIPRENRLCDCEADIQTEAHIIESCHISQPIRDKYTHINFSLPEIFLNRDKTKLCKALTEIYKLYQ